VPSASTAAGNAHPAPPRCRLGTAVTFARHHHNHEPGQLPIRNTDVPKLLLTFDSSPTLMIGPELADWCAANIANLEIEACAPAGHLAPEDRPKAIATVIAAWLDRRWLRSPEEPA
jgi:pimeloyl-ACP methyl ester carboxylesterase